MIKKAMIMSAGVGSRLDPLTRNVPKPLVPIANIPTMDILLNHIKNHGITEVIANTYYLAEQVQDRYTKKSPIDINFNYIREETLSGTAGGVKKCQFFFKPDEKFIVMSADGLTDIDITKAITSHIESNSIATIVTHSVDINEVNKFGVIVTDENGFIKEFQEKPEVKDAKSNLVNTGIYVFNYEIFNYIPENTKYDFAKDVFPKLLTDGIKINTYNEKCYWSDIGSISQYIESTNDLLNNNIKIDNLNITTTNTAKFVKTNGSNIANMDSIQGLCSIGDNTKIPKSSTIKNSILWDNITICENVIVENCIIASDTTIMKSIKDKIIEPNSIIK